MKRKTKAALSLFLAALALLAVFTSCKPDSPLPDDVLDASDLRGQWEMYTLTLDETNTDPPMIEETGVIIDIQYTMPGSWIRWNLPTTENEPTTGVIMESNRTETEDGWFIISYPDSTNPLYTIKYRFKDGNRDVLECLVSSGNSEETKQCILIRILESRALTITI
ncbi:MAG TPA: hypothetical protein IAA76_00940 [Candidatus Ornithospirochaeta stercorigallinarum]|nr:hypothetical protein [Candidatus Ornithospirochaeta stercorigallinarum]